MKRRKKINFQSRSMNSLDLKNYVNGKPEINALIPGINPGFVMNPNYNKEKSFMKGPADRFLNGKLKVNSYLTKLIFRNTKNILNQKVVIFQRKILIQ